MTDGPKAAVGCLAMLIVGAELPTLCALHANGYLRGRWCLAILVGTPIWLPVVLRFGYEVGRICGGRIGRAIEWWGELWLKDFI